MDLHLEAARIGNYASGLQKARVLTEPWVASQAYCLNCGGAPLQSYPNNSRVGDFFCPACQENYELKSKRTHFGTRVDDGAYRIMLQRLNGNANPNLMLLNYSAASMSVTNLVVIPKHFITADMIEERKPLPPTARRAGWIGCRIRLQTVPHAGRIAMVRDSHVRLKPSVLSEWKRTIFLRQQHNIEARGWLLHVMQCIERLGKQQFTLMELYQYEGELGVLYPSNRNVRPKIRQKLQVLRENGYLQFLGNGTYRLVEMSER